MSLQSKRKGRSTLIVRNKEKMVKTTSLDRKENYHKFQMDIELEERIEQLSKFEGLSKERWRTYKRHKSKQSLKDFIQYQSQRMDEGIHFKNQSIIHQIRRFQELGSQTLEINSVHTMMVKRMTKTFEERQKILQSIFRNQLNGQIKENVMLLQKIHNQHFNAKKKEKSVSEALEEQTFRKVQIDDRVFYGTFERVVHQRYLENYSRLQTQSEIDTEHRIIEAKQIHKLYDGEVKRLKERYHFRRDEERKLAENVLTQLIRLRTHNKQLLTWKMKWMNNLKNYEDRNLKILDEKNSLFQSLLRLKGKFDKSKYAWEKKLQKLVCTTHRIQKRYHDILAISQRCLVWEKLCSKLEQIDDENIRTNWIGGTESSIMKKLEIYDLGKLNVKKKKMRRMEKESEEIRRRRCGGGRRHSLAAVGTSSRFSYYRNKNTKNSKSIANSQSGSRRRRRRHSTCEGIHPKKSTAPNLDDYDGDRRRIMMQEADAMSRLSKLEEFQKRMNRAVVEVFELEDRKRRELRKNSQLRSNLKTYMSRLDMSEGGGRGGAQQDRDISGILTNRRKYLVTRSSSGRNGRKMMQAKRRYSDIKRPFTTSFLDSRSSVRRKKFIF